MFQNMHRLQDKRSVQDQAVCFQRTRRATLAPVLCLKGPAYNTSKGLSTIVPLLFCSESKGKEKKDHVLTSTQQEKEKVPCICFISSGELAELTSIELRVSLQRSQVDQIGFARREAQLEKRRIGFWYLHDERSCTINE